MPGLGTTAYPSRLEIGDDLEMLSLLPAALVPIGILAFMIFKILKEYERGVIFRLGRLVGVRGPGLTLLIPGIERMERVDLRTVTMDIPAQDVITRDNVSVQVNAVLYFRVLEPAKAIVEIENYLFATSQLAQTTMRSICGQAELDDLLSEREKLNEEIQTILDEQTDPWGIKVVSVELKHIDLPPDMQRAMARQAEAERDRRAKVINAEGEYQAAEKLAAAAAIISEHPRALHLRYFETLTEMAQENESITVFPLPTELIAPFLSNAEKDGGSSDAEKDGGSSK